jgi:NitT/TauT family transport system permease protein
MTVRTVLRRVATPVLFGVLLLVAWQLLVDVNDIPRYLLPSPTAIGEELGANASDIVTAARASGRNAVIGLLLGIVVALVAAVVGMWVPLLERLLTPLASAVAAAPIVALAPVLSIMFSATSDLPRRIIVSIVAFFPVFVTTVRGLRRMDPVHAELMRSYAATSWATTRTVRLPGAVPYVFNGIRVAASLAVISAVVAEYFGGLQNGVGSRITSAASNTAYARAWAYVVAAIVLGLLFYLAALTVERLASRGQSAENT